MSRPARGWSGTRSTAWQAVLLSGGAWALGRLLGRARRPRESLAPAPPTQPPTTASAPPGASPRRPWLGDPRRCVVADLMLLALGVGAAVSCLAGNPGTLRLLLVLAAVCLLPGGAVLTLLEADDALQAAGLAIGLGICVEAIGTLAMIWAGWWHPTGWAIAVGAIACLLVSADLWRSVGILRAAGRPLGETNG